MVKPHVLILDRCSKLLTELLPEGQSRVGHNRKRVKVIRRALPKKNNNKMQRSPGNENNVNRQQPRRAWVQIRRCRVRRRPLSTTSAGLAGEESCTPSPAAGLTDPASRRGLEPTQTTKQKAKVRSQRRCGEECTPNHRRATPPPSFLAQAPLATTNGPRGLPETGPAGTPIASRLSR